MEWRQPNKYNNERPQLTVHLHSLQRTMLSGYFALKTAECGK